MVTSKDENFGNAGEMVKLFEKTKARHLNFLAKDEPGYLAARKWLDERKGKEATVADITEEDRLAFSAFFFETYMQKVTSVLRRIDPNHMYLCCRFN